MARGCSDPRDHPRHLHCAWRPGRLVRRDPVGAVERRAPTAGELFELDAIAAVVIGGTSLLGGIGTVRGSILGASFIGALNNGMSLLDITEFYQKVIKGVIIILAVWFDMRQSPGGAKKAT